MTALMDLYEAVKSGVDWADNVFVKNIDESEAKTDLTFLLVRDATQELDNYGSNTFHTMTYTLQIQIFYASDSDLDYDEVELKLFRYLESKGYLISNVRGRLQDPDTYQDYQTFLVNIEKEV
ncbi:hypothetical protein R077811_01541 [Convivina intestini]|nr:hypothetical protein R077811_01541 [Convivina intestini]